MLQKLPAIFLFLCLAPSLKASSFPAINCSPDTLLPPVCTAAPDITVGCEAFDPTLSLYPGIIDQSASVVSVSVSIDYTQFDSACNRGIVTRNFEVFDSLGQSGTCSQQIRVNYKQDYFIHFPDDVAITACTGVNGNYGQPEFFGQDCELLSFTYEDLIYDGVPDACFTIHRSWSIVNWCTFDPAKLPVHIPNPGPSPIINDPANLPGPIVSNINTPGDPWQSTVVKIHPTDPQPTDFSIFYDPDANGYSYEQIIKISDTQNPEIISAPNTTQIVGDTSTNDSQLWNASYWWDNANQSHDLCEAPAEISITATDACSGPNISIQYLLYLDLDGDGITETLINSNLTGLSSLGWNKVPFGNVSGAGQARQFDFRPVPDNEKWGFALEQTVNGNNRTATVRFNTLSQQTSYVNPQLPPGVHKIKWIIEDACGNSVVKEYLIIVKDTQAPSVTCINGLSVNILPVHLVTLYAADFLQYATDNCTPFSLLKYGIRKSGTGTGFPVDANGNPVTAITYNCTELGTQQVELWCIDQAGNGDFCETYVIVQDNAEYCNGIAGGGHLYVDCKNELGIPTDGVDVWMDFPGSMFVPPLSIQLTPVWPGGFDYNVQQVPATSLDSVWVRPEKIDNPLNGVSTYDLVLINQHILGQQPLNSPYKFIAADVNKNAVVTSYDMLLIKQLILGITSEFPDHSSWRFVDKNQLFNHSYNPYGGVLQERIRFHQQDSVYEFVSVKLGDVNNAIPLGPIIAGDRAAPQMPFQVKGPAHARAGEAFDLHIQADTAMVGCQFTLNFSGLQVNDILPGENMRPDQFALFPEKNALTMAWETGGIADFTLKCRATQDIDLAGALELNSRITRAEGYLADARNEKSDKVILCQPVLKFPENTGLVLYQNQPNPFRGETMISFLLPESGNAILTVFDAQGRILYSDTRYYPAGLHQVRVSLPEATGAVYYEVVTEMERKVKKSWGY